MRRGGALALGLVMAFLWLAVGVIPAGAKGPQPTAIRAPAEATAGEVVTVRATIKGPVVPPEQLASEYESLRLRRVTRQRPLMWIGQDVIRVTFVHDGGSQYSARVTVPDTPGRYLFHGPYFRLWELNHDASAERERAPWLIVRAATTAEDGSRNS